MEDGHIPKDILYGELATGARSRGRPRLRFKDVCKRDMKACKIDVESWEYSADARDIWRFQVSSGLQNSEDTLRDQAEEKRAKRKASSQQHPPTSAQDEPQFTCPGCGRTCRSRIGLYSHTRRCQSHGANP